MIESPTFPNIYQLGGWFKWLQTISWESGRELPRHLRKNPRRTWEWHRSFREEWHRFFWEAWLSEKSGIQCWSIVCQALVVVLWGGRGQWRFSISQEGRTTTSLEVSGQDASQKKPHYAKSLIQSTLPIETFVPAGAELDMDRIYSALMHKSYPHNLSCWCWPCPDAGHARMDVEDVIKVMKAAVGNPQVQQQGPVVAVVPRRNSNLILPRSDSPKAQNTHWLLHVSVPNVVGHLNQDSSIRFQLSPVFNAWFSDRFQEVSTNKLFREPIRAGWFVSDASWFHELILAFKPDEAPPLSN